MTNKEYRATDAVSRSELSILLKETPLHFKYHKDHPKEDTASLAFGRAAHKYILEKELFNLEFAVAPLCDRRTKAGKTQYDEFLQECAGKEVITAADYEIIKDMAKAVDEDPFARAFLTGECEESFFWIDKETGEKCKVHPDCITIYEGKKYIVDYKTTDSCADGAFEKSVRKYGYKFQSGMYREGVFQNTFEDYGFAFVAQEKKAPYACRVYICNEDFLIEGYEQFRKAINLFHWCKTNECWYGYEGAESLVSELVGEGEI